VRVLRGGLHLQIMQRRSYDLAEMIAGMDERESETGKGHHDGDERPEMAFLEATNRRRISDEADDRPRPR